MMLTVHTSSKVYEGTEEKKAEIHRCMRVAIVEVADWILFNDRAIGMGGDLRPVPSF